MALALSLGRWRGGLSEAAQGVSEPGSPGQVDVMGPGCQWPGRLWMTLALFLLIDHHVAPIVSNEVSCPEMNPLIPEAEEEPSRSSSGVCVCFVRQASQNMF